MEDKEPLKEFVLFNIERLITRLYKSNLIHLSDIHQKNLEIAFDLKDKIKDENIMTLDDRAFTKYRKKILDDGNETIREIRQILDKVDFTLCDKVDLDNENE